MDRKELEAECNEQARLNGMGAEREARLMAELEAVKAERDALAKDAARIDWIGAHVKAVILHGDTAPRLLWADTELPRYPRDVRSGIDAAMAEGER